MRDAYLEAMGIERWVRREPASTDEPVPGDNVEKSSDEVNSSSYLHPGVYVEEVSSGSKPIEGVPTSTTEVYGDEPQVSQETLTVLQPVTTRTSHLLDELGWDELQQQVATCTQCDLHSTRTQTVFGVGNREADWMIIGEAPGADEDRQGEPFVGRAGQLLTAMIAAMGMKREQVYIANILKCRPPQNRDPKPDEVMDCMAFLHRQIQLVQPKVILAVGRIAAQNLLDTDAPMKTMRGNQYSYADTGIPVFVTYHPAYLLRSPGEKRKAWQDLQLAMRCYDEVGA